MRILARQHAFGGAALGDRYVMVGGMREGFQLVEDCAAFDLEVFRGWLMAMLGLEQSQVDLDLNCDAAARRRLLDDRYPTANTGTCGAQGYEGYVYLGCRADVAGHDNVPNKIKKHIRTVSGCAAACDAESTCKGFLQRDADGGCYLKSGGWPYTADPNCAFSGSDDFPDPENGLIFYKCDHGVELGKLPAVSSPS